MLNSEVVSKSDNSFYTPGTFLVTVNSGLAMTFSPAAISVHYDANMGGDIAMVDFTKQTGFEGFSVLGHAAGSLPFVFGWNYGVDRADFSAFAAAGALGRDDIGKADFYCFNRTYRVAGTA